MLKLRISRAAVRRLTPVSRKMAVCYRAARFGLNERVLDARRRPISLANLICSSERPSENPLSRSRSKVIPSRTW